MSTEAKQGEDLLLKIGSKIYGAADSMSFEQTTETKEITTYKQGTAADGKFKSRKVVSHSWTASTDNGVFDYDDAVELINLQQAGTPVAVSAVEATIDDDDSYEANEQGFSISGNAIITSISISAPKDGEVTASIKLEGVGKPTAANTAV